MFDNLPAFAICGWSGSGKTTLIEQIIPTLCKKGLKIVVVKHDTHGIDVDNTGKDSDRFLQAGADVLLQGPKEELQRIHRSDSESLRVILARLAQQYDLVLIEGNKGTALPKIWLLSEDELAPLAANPGRHGCPSVANWSRYGTTRAPALRPRSDS